MTLLRGAIIGFGKIAELGHWPTYSDSADVQIAAIVDPSPERQKVARMLKPGVRTYRDLEDLFHSETIDFVDICTPPSSHAKLALKALGQGCHVLCEKPL